MIISAPAKAFRSANSFTIPIDFIPALLAAITPLGVSSNTIQFIGFTFSFLAVNKYISGSGLPLFTSSADTIALKIHLNLVFSAHNILLLWEMTMIKPW